MAALAMTRALASRGHEVTLATTDAASDAGARLDVPVTHPVIDAGVTIRYFARWPARPWKFSWTMTAWMARHIAEFDVVHVHGLFNYPTIPACRLARWHAVPYVLRPVGTLGSWSLDQRSWKKRPYIAAIERSHIRHAAALHATSDAEAGFVRQMGARRVEVIPLGVQPPAPPAARRASEGGQPLRVLFLSRIHPVKGIPVLLDAVRIARSRGASLDVTIAGSGDVDYVASMRALGTQLGVDDVVTWAGQVDGTNKADLFASADVFVLPSSHENFGIAVAESLAAGVPVIVSREVAIGDEVERAGAGVALPLDASRFAAALIEFAGNPKRRQDAGLAAVALARAAYSWPACAKRLEALYTDLISRKEPPR